MSWTDDPIADFHRHDAEQEAKLEKQPYCCECGEPIQEEKAVQLPNGDWYCKQCEPKAWERIREEYLVGTSEL